MSRSGPGAPSQRQLRVGELVRHAVSEALARGEIMDPVLETHLVTVSEVRMSPDLKHATCFVEPLGGVDEAAVVAALTAHRRYIRGLVSRRLTLKYMPELRFEIDTRFADDRRIDELLRSREVARDLDADD
ncbi:MAG TPA: 30S ribosome-binding factor RbfA [Kaistiaceae bacterium]|nr:30S ribosome-binding factor RbfA [Kaistiaceae bacterium]